MIPLPLRPTRTRDFDRCDARILEVGLILIKPISRHTRTHYNKGFHRARGKKGNGGTGNSMITTPTAARKIASVLGASAVGVTSIVVAAMSPQAANAKPPAPVAFCQAYPDAQACQTGFADCTTCHTTAPARNSYGAQLADRILPGTPRPLSDKDFLAALPGALKAVEALDADSDGFANLVELGSGASMASADSVPLTLACTPEQAAKSATARWNTCGYDPEFAFRKIHLDFCGRSPKREDMEALKLLRGNETAWRSRLGQALDQCLASSYWIGTDGVVWNLANAKIRPAHTVKSGKNPGPVPLGDYDDDYNLFVWANSGDRDVRDLLLAQYFVKRVSDSPVKLEKISEEELAKRDRGTKQPVPPEKRAGMITTRWFAAVHTMFTAIPRTTAAQAYRAYLGFDIAKMQGLQPVPHEPTDYDAKGVGAPQCAACHSTLDPMAYAFTRYNGIGGGYTYDENRLEAYTKVDGPRVKDAPKTAVILGQEANDLVEMAKIAASSDAFARKVVFDYWKLLIGRDPTIQDQAEYNRLWQDLKSPGGHNYRVERMLHALVFTNAYGRP